MCASTGWTWDYVENHVTMPRLNALTKYWADHPPLHLLVAGYLGVKPKPKTPEPSAPLPDIEE